MQSFEIHKLVLILIFYRLSALSLSQDSFYTSLLNVYLEVMQDDKGVINPRAVKEAVGRNERRFSGSSQQVFSVLLILY